MFCFTAQHVCVGCSMELYGDNLMEFFAKVEVANFEIASDAFSSFKVLQPRWQMYQESAAAGAAGA